MLSHRYRILMFAGAALAGVWLLAWLGYSLAKRSRVTGESIRAYVQKTDLRQLTGRERERAIRKLADQLNRLPWDERQQARIEGVWRDWFQDMDDAERTQFVEATLPTGMKQMLNAFEALPADKRRRAIDDAVRNLQRDRNRLRGEGRLPADNNAPPISDELRQRIVAIGLNAFYNESSAQTKAEVAPFLEELQRAMESGRLLLYDRPRQPPQ